jgi:hypothetical protein
VKSLNARVERSFAANPGADRITFGKRLTESPSTGRGSGVLTEQVITSTLAHVSWNRSALGCGSLLPPALLREQELPAQGRERESGRTS